ncbi:hypothetical protein ZHAS_00003380 [Anopheles sinensis]|uniref:DUF1736 domain-containing protein n=1 Tax=Anopheles sinensis TaxID=74873 RepID=A0A084VE69_ANOSI|nr:hypothetical protein ZHAS_00003380 [Anopheles sinensis]
MNSLWLSIVLGGLSMLAKETGITVFLLNVAYDTYRNWPALKRAILEMRWSEETHQFGRRVSRVLLSMGVLLAVRLALLQGSLPKFSQQDNPTAFHPNLYVRLLTFCYLAAFNWWLLLCPSTLSHDWQMGSIPLVTTLSDPRNLLTFAAFCAALLFTYRGLMDCEKLLRPSRAITRSRNDLYCTFERGKDCIFAHGFDAFASAFPPAFQMPIRCAEPIAINCANIVSCAEHSFELRFGFRRIGKLVPRWMTRHKKYTLPDDYPV